MMSVIVSTKMIKGLENIVNNVSRETISKCASIYGFSEEEAMTRLGMVLVVEEVSRARGEKKEKKEKKEKEEKCKIPVPFSGVVVEGCCRAIKANHGLYSQCTNRSETMLCKGCEKGAEKNASGLPDNGLVERRVAEGVEWRDAKGRTPTAYVKVMRRLKLTEEQVLAETAKFGIDFNAELHFAEVAKVAKEPKARKEPKATKEGKRGRPKKAAKVVEVDATEDLFATLAQNAKEAAASVVVEEEGEEGEVVEGSSSSSVTSDLTEDSDAAGVDSTSSKKKNIKVKVNAEEKAAKAVAKEAEKAAKAVAKEAEKAAKAVAKEAEKAAKAVAKGATKKATKKSKKEESTPIVDDSEEELVEEELVEEGEEEEPAAVTVKKFEFEGKMYLKSSDNVLYDAESQDEVGVWSDSKQCIEFLETDDE